MDTQSDYLKSVLPLLWAGRIEEAKQKLARDLILAKVSAEKYRKALEEAESLVKAIESAWATAGHTIEPIVTLEEVHAGNVNRAFDEAVRDQSRRDDIVKAAKDVVRQTKCKDFTIEQVKEELAKSGSQLGGELSKLGTSIGNTLGKSGEFQRLLPSFYRYLPNDIEGATISQARSLKADILPSPSYDIGYGRTEIPTRGQP